MEYLWAPWRMEYILGKKKRGCFLCKKLKAKKNKEHLILCQGRHAFVIMNKFPYTNGHLMVVPKRHCLHLEQLRRDESEELFGLLKASVSALKASFHPHGFNIGMNIGKMGGAGEDHLHLHVVPRWAGDTNFMPVLGKTKVISQYLEETYEKLRSAFGDLLTKKGVRKGG
jgi:ATP adenylyltransferase